MNTPSFQPQQRKSHVLRNALLAFGTLIILAALVGVVLFNGITTDIFGGCTDKQKGLDRAAQELRQEATGLRIDGQAPTKIDAAPNGDCLTGSASSATVTFALAEPSVTEASAKIASGLKMAPDALAADLRPELGSSNDFAGGTHITSVIARVSAGQSHLSDIRYKLAKPIDCRTVAAQGTCGAEDKQLLSTFKALEQPVSSIVLTLSREYGL